MAACPGHLDTPATFFRAITKPPDLRNLFYNYKIGCHPREHSDLPGDFAYDGALYVMAVSTCQCVFSMDSTSTQN